MTTQQLFDLVAPIAIYHGTDVRYKEKAIAAIHILSVNKAAMVRMNFGNAAGPEDWQDYLEHYKPANLPDIVELYGILFNEIMEEEMEGVKKSYDRWGAIQYHDLDGQYIFSGDACGAYPWFETAELLVERLTEHANEHARDHEPDLH